MFMFNRFKGQDSSVFIILFDAVHEPREVGKHQKMSCSNTSTCPLGTKLRESQRS